MAKKQTARIYLVKLSVRAIVEKEVPASSWEEALSTAESMRNDDLFLSEWEYVDGRVNVAGVEDMTEWNVAND